MKISNTELKVVRFANEDVIATSLYVIPNGDNYDIYNGTMLSYSPTVSAWSVAMGDYDRTLTADESTEFRQNPSRHHMYDAYLYSDSQYYTNGVEYPATIESSGQGATGGPTPGSGPAIPGFPGFGN